MGGPDGGAAALAGAGVDDESTQAAAEPAAGDVAGFVVFTVGFDDLDGAGLAVDAAEVAAVLEGAQVVGDAAGGGQPGGAGEVPDGGWVAVVPDMVGDAVQDGPLAGGEVRVVALAFGHAGTIPVGSAAPR